MQLIIKQQQQIRWYATVNFYKQNGNIKYSSFERPLKTGFVSMKSSSEESSSTMKFLRLTIGRERD